MPLWNPLSWGDNYRESLKQEIQRLGDEAARYVDADCESKLSRLSPEAGDILMRIVRGQLPIEAFHIAVREKEIDRYIARQVETMLRQCG